MDSCRISVDLDGGSITATMHTTSAGQGHETMVGTVVGEVLEIDPERVRVVRADSLNSLPSNSPVGSRMAIMLGGAAFHAANKIKDKLIAIAAHDLGVPAERLAYKDGDVFDTSSPDKKAHLDRAGHHRAPADPQAAGRHGAGAVDQPHHAGADRRPVADRRRPRADVSLLRLRIPSRADERSIPISASRRSSATSSATTAAP